MMTSSAKRFTRVKKPTTRTETVRQLIANDPVEIGHQLGFTLLTDIHNDWIKNMLYGRTDSTLQGHRGSYKTTCLAIVLYLLMICRPNEKIVLFRKTDADVKEIIAQIKKMLLTDFTQYIVNALWGVDLIITTSNVTELSTNLTNDPRGGAQLTAMGIGGSITGKHYDRVFTDDIVNIEDRVSKAERERTKLFYQELQNIKNRGGRIFNTGTPWHKEDAFTLMPEPKRYDVYSTGLISVVEQAFIKSRMTASLYAANYELKHIASEDVIFTDPVIGYDPAIIYDCNFCHIDAAYGGSDSTAFTICKKKDGKYYVFGKLWNKHVDDCQTDIIKYRKAFRAGRIYCENNGDKGYLAKELRKKGETVATYHEDMNKLLKITSYLKFNWKNVVFVQGTDEAYLNQITEFTEEADHDDAPDSLACLIRLQANRADDAYSSVFGKH